MGKLTNIFYVNLIASIILYDGGILGLLVKQFGLSTHNFQIISVFCINLSVLFFSKEKYFKFYKLHKTSIIIFLTFGLYYFLLTDFQNEYSSYKFELIIFNLIIFVFSIPLIYNSKKYRLLLLLLVINVLTSVIFNYLYPNNLDLTLAEDVQRTTFGEPIIYSRLIGLIIIIVYFNFKNIRFYLIPFLILMLITISTRTILFTTITLLFIHFLFQRKSRYFLFKFILSVSIILLLVLFWEEYQSIFIDSRLSSLNDGGRSQMIYDSIKMFLNSPLIGNGVGSFSELHNSVGYFNRVYPHNIILELLAENGIIGLFLFSFLLYSLFSKYKNLSSNTFIIYFAFFSIISALTSLDLPNQFLIFNLMILIVFSKNIDSENRILN